MIITNATQITIEVQKGCKNINRNFIYFMFISFINTKREFTITIEIFFNYC